MKTAVILSLLFAFTFARKAYICDVAVPGDFTVPQLSFPNMMSYGWDNFNFISFNTFGAPSSDVEGRAAIRNTLNIADYSFGYELRTGGSTATELSLPYCLVVGGDATFVSGAVLPDGSQFPYPGNQENIYVGGSFTGADYLVQRRTGGPGSIDADFAQAQTFYGQLSDALAGVTDTATGSVQYGTLTLTCASIAADTNSITIHASDFNTITSYTLVNCADNSAIIINIDGSEDVLFAGDNIHHDVRTVVYNVVNSLGRTVNIQTEVDGSILAPFATYSQKGMGVVKGLVICGDAPYVHQVNIPHCHQHPDTPTPPPQCGFEGECAGFDFGSFGSFIDFNAVVFGDFHSDSGDVEGRLAVKGNAQLNTYSVGYQLDTVEGHADRHLPYSLIVNGDLTFTSGAVYPQGDGIPRASQEEDIAVHGAFTGSADLGSRVTTVDDVTSFFNAAQGCYQSISDNLAAQPDNVAHYVQWSALVITCNDDSDSYYFITLTPQELSQFTYTTISNCNLNANWVFNFGGVGDIEITGDSYPVIPGGATCNIIGTRNVYVHDTSLNCNLLAVTSTLDQPTGVIRGKVVAGKVTRSLQINRENTCATPVTVTVLLVASADVAAGSDVVSLVNPDVIDNGDDIVSGSGSYSVADISLDGDVTVSPPLAIDVAKGQVVGSYSYSSIDGRNRSARSSNSASSMSIAVAILAIAALLI